MAKNPLLNKQALPGSYADYLTRGQNAHAAAGPNNFNAIIANNDKIANSPVYDDGKYNSDVVMYKGTTPGVSTPSASPATAQTPYEIWKEMYGKQAQLMPTQSYTDWLMAGGMAGAAQKQYDATVRSAETDYEKSKALYGANAERLGRAGLTGSGYTDYLTGAGFSAMQGAKVAAADTKALTEAQQRSDYASYLMGVQQTNAQLQAQADAANRQSYAEYLTREGGVKETIDSMMQSGQDDEAIKAYIQQHYGNQFDSQLDGWITGAHSYNDPIIAETNAAKTEAETEDANAAALERAQKAYSALLAGYQDGAIVNVDTANAEMKRAGFTQTEIDKALAEYSESTIQRLRTNMNISGAALADVPTSAYIDDLVTTGQITQPQADAFKSEAQAKRVELLDKKYDDLTNENAPDFINQVHSLYKSGDLSREKYAEYIGNLVAENVASISDDAAVKEPVYEIAAIISDIKNDDKYNDIEADLLKSIANTVNVKYDNRGKLVFDVGGKKEKIDFNYWQMHKYPGMEKIYGEGYEGKITGHDGGIYIYLDGRWSRIYELSVAGVGTPEYASLILDLLKAKYN